MGSNSTQGISFFLGVVLGIVMLFAFAITKYGSTYIGMTQVVLHYAHTLEIFICLVTLLVILMDTLDCRASWVRIPPRAVPFSLETLNVNVQMYICLLIPLPSLRSLIWVTDLTHWIVL